MLARLLPWLLIGGSFLALGNVWITTALYHGWILFYWASQRAEVRVPWAYPSRLQWGVLAGVTALCTLCLPLVVGLWPYAARPGTDLPAALASMGLAGHGFPAFVVYLCTVHPWLEETYWRGLLPRDRWTDLAFAGFHIFLVWPFLKPVWAVPVVVALLVGAWLWRWSIRRFDSLFIAVVSHAVADAAIMGAVAWLTVGNATA